MRLLQRKKRQGEDSDMVYKIVILVVILVPFVYTTFVEVRFEGSVFDSLHSYMFNDKRDLESREAQTKSGPSNVSSLLPEEAAMNTPASPAVANNSNQTTATPSGTDNTTTIESSNSTASTEDIMVPAIDYGYEFIGYKDYKTRFPLPDWMAEMLASQPANDPRAHHEMLTDPGNKFIVMACYKHTGHVWDDCGGFTDRVALLPYWLWMAHQTGRKLLIRYHKPCPLEHFLVPPKDGFDWRLPEGYFEEDWRRYGNRSQKQYMEGRRAFQQLMDHRGNIVEDAPRVLFVNNNLAIPPVRGALQDAKIGVRADDIWAGLFRHLFQPSPEVAHRMAPLIQRYSLEAGNYAATHLRIKWPDRKFGQYLHYTNIPKWWWADKADAHLNTTHPETLWVLSTLGDHAVTCALRIMPEAKHVYLASDGYEAIDYLKHASAVWSDSATHRQPRSFPGADPAFANSTNGTEHGWGVPAWEVDTTNAQIIARLDYKTGGGNHFDATVWDEPALGYNIFVDLWMMTHAKCHSHGAGGYGRFASLLSGNRKTCSSRHRDYAGQVPSCASPTERKAWKRLHPNIEYPLRRRRRHRRR